MIHHDLLGPLGAATNQVTLNHGDMVRIGLVKWTFSFELPRTDRRTERTPKRPKVAVEEDRKEREKGKVSHAQSPGCGSV
jgi:hypothetical protein